MIRVMPLVSIPVCREIVHHEIMERDFGQSERIRTSHGFKHETCVLRNELVSRSDQFDMRIHQHIVIDHAFEYQPLNLKRRKRELTMIDRRSTDPSIDRSIFLRFMHSQSNELNRFEFDHHNSQSRSSLSDANV
jgi:hypothetical protein